MIIDRKPHTIRRWRLWAAMPIAAAATALTIAGCASGSAKTVPAPQATGDAVSAQPTSLGTILVDGKGRTVYDFANDQNSTSTCTDAACVATWPYVAAPASPPTSVPGVTGALGTTTRPDGAHQLTVAGHPVYTFAGDSAPGQTNGQGQTLNGGLWTVVSAAGAPLINPTPAGATLAPTSPSY